jgi:hypothetical protein
VTAQPDAELVAGLYGEEPAEDGAEARTAEPAVVIPQVPVRGRARVVQATIVADEQVEPDAEPESPRPAGAARGQARVVSITDARPAAGVARPNPPVVPGQRTPEPDEPAADEAAADEAAADEPPAADEPHPDQKQ